MPSPYARTLRQVVNDTLRFCNDYRGDAVNGLIWQWAEVAAKGNDLLIDIVRRTGILRDTAIIQLQTDVSVYDLPPDCVRPLRFMVNGLGGTLILPRTMSELDLQGQPMNVEGDPYYFMRDLLGPDQVAFFPTPYQDGSTFTRDSDYGSLRGIQDAEGNYLPYDANLPLRRIAGVPFVRTGDGHIIREVISPMGNIQVTYVRAPANWSGTDVYPDDGIPEFIHKDLKFGLAELILPASKKPLHILKLARAKQKWANVIFNLQRIAESQGAMAGMEPV